MRRIARNGWIDAFLRLSWSEDEGCMRLDWLSASGTLGISLPCTIIQYPPYLPQPYSIPLYLMSLDTLLTVPFTALECTPPLPYPANNSPSAKVAVPYLYRIPTLIAQRLHVPGTLDRWTDVASPSPNGKSTGGYCSVRTRGRIRA